MSLYDFPPKLSLPSPFSQMLGASSIWAVSVKGPNGGPAKSGEIVTLDGWTMRFTPTSKRKIRELSRPRPPEPEYGEDWEP